MSVHITPANDADANAIATALEGIRPWPGYQRLARSGGPWVFMLDAQDAEALLDALYPEVTQRLTIAGAKRTGGVVRATGYLIGEPGSPPAAAPDGLTDGLTGGNDDTAQPAAIGAADAALEPPAAPSAEPSAESSAEPPAAPEPSAPVKKARRR